MATPRRILLCDALYHVYTCATGPSPLFRDRRDHEHFNRTLRKTVEMYGWRVLIWVHMTTHVHLLVRTPEPNLDAGMQRTKSCYALEKLVEGDASEAVSDWLTPAEVGAIEDERAEGERGQAECDRDQRDSVDRRERGDREAAAEEDEERGGEHRRAVAAGEEVVRARGGPAQHAGERTRGFDAK
jgi:hypothetical protein